MSNVASIRKSFDVGFALNEQEMRRIYDIIINQMKILSPQGNIKTTFTLTYKNKITEEKDDINSIFSETNGGIWEIKTLAIRSIDKTSPFECDIKIEFDKHPGHSIFYSIEAPD